MKSVGNSVRDGVWSSAADQVEGRVADRVWSRVGECIWDDHVGDDVWRCATSHVWGLVEGRNGR